MKLNYVLGAGSHDPDSGEYCLMEAVAHELGKPHTAKPDGVPGVVTSFGMTLNDWLSDEERQLLVPVIPLIKVVGPSRHSQMERAFVAVDYGVRKLAPIYMRLKSRGSSAKAAQLEKLPPIINTESASLAPRYGFVKSALQLFQYDTVLGVAAFARKIANHPRAASTGARERIVVLSIECLKAMCDLRRRRL